MEPIDSRGLARRLREYGVKPRMLRVGGATPNGYLPEDLHDAWSTISLQSKPSRKAIVLTRGARHLPLPAIGTTCYPGYSRQ